MAQKRSKVLLTVLLALALPVLAAATDFYASPTGSPIGDGSMGSPWNLQTALDQPPSVQPGDTIWLRGGTYAGTYTSNLTGTAALPIVVRQYPGERATIDGGNSNGTDIFTISGSYTWYWGFEIMSCDPNRVSQQPGSAPTDIGRGNGIVNGTADGIKIINMIIHDTRQGISAFEGWTNTEVYGNLIYFNGWDGPDRSHGHGIYAQNQAPSVKQITDNISFDGFAVGIHAYTQGGHLDNLDIEGNVLFDNGVLSHVTGLDQQLLVGGTNGPANNPKWISNYTYCPWGHSDYNNLGYDGGCVNGTVTGNYFVDWVALALVNCSSGLSMTDNTFYGGIYGFTESEHLENTYSPSRPMIGLQIFVRPNTYESGRANITIYNWSCASAVSVDLSGVLSVGSTYQIQNAQDFFGAPVLTGTYDGNPVSIPMTGLSVATPVGWPAPSPTGPEFNAFVLITTVMATSGPICPPSASCAPSLAPSK